MDTDEVLDGCSGAISSREVSTAHGSKKLRLEDGSATTTSVSSDGALSLKKEGEGEGKGGDAGGQSEEKKARPAEVECSDIAGGTPLGLTHHPKEPRSVEPHATKSCATTGVAVPASSSLDRTDSAASAADPGGNGGDGSNNDAGRVDADGGRLGKTQNTLKGVKLEKGQKFQLETRELATRHLSTGAGGGGGGGAAGAAANTGAPIEFEAAEGGGGSGGGRGDDSGSASDDAEKKSQHSHRTRSRLKDSSTVVQLNSSWSGGSGGISSFSPGGPTAPTPKCLLPSADDGLVKGELELKLEDAFQPKLSSGLVTGLIPGHNTKVVEMIKEGTDGTGKGERRRFVSCRAAMDFLGIQGHSTFYKHTRSQSPFNGWLLVDKDVAATAAKSMKYDKDMVQAKLEAKRVASAARKAPDDEKQRIEAIAKKERMRSIRKAEAAAKKEQNQKDRIRKADQAAAKKKAAAGEGWDCLCGSTLEPAAGFGAQCAGCQRWIHGECTGVAAEADVPRWFRCANCTMDGQSAGHKLLCSTSGCAFYAIARGKCRKHAAADGRGRNGLRPDGWDSGDSSHQEAVSLLLNLVGGGFS